MTLSLSCLVTLKRGRGGEKGEEGERVTPCLEVWGVEGGKGEEERGREKYV